MDRPRILLVPSLTELEWTIKPLLEEWADVASYDAPGVGDEPPAEGVQLEATAERGLAELDRRGWDRCVVAGDEFGSLAAILLAHARQDAVAGLALGHATANYRRGSARPAINAAVTEGLAQLEDVDFRSFVRQEFRAWHGLRHAFDESDASDAMADEYLSRVPHEVATAFHRGLTEHDKEFAALVDGALHDLAMPLLLVQHERCLMFTKEGFDDIVAEFAEATQAKTTSKPSVDPAFSPILRDFCARIDAAAPATPKATERAEQQ
jgi:pimeloyl-ACP methyl ester carboxylesterase